MMTKLSSGILEASVRHKHSLSNVEGIYSIRDDGIIQNNLENYNE